ncbi:DUF1365 domain-containing protein [Sansalvadorimonas verongulae]|nr:DUF1365 domain-containing protein [Sansalvadorimonas verongulae]
MHNRVKPRKHRFTYKVASWLFDLDELDTLDHTLTFFSRNRLNLVSFHDGDYGDGSDKPLKIYIRDLLCEQGIDKPERIELLCYPRILGYAFNPLAVYFCYSNDGQVMAVVYEVSNTFGERHSYVIPADASGSEAIRQQADKKLHVSPFFETDGCSYQFRTHAPDEQVVLGISLHQQEERLFSAVFRGERQSVSDRQVLKQLIGLPFMTVKVVVAIHWEALKLWLKRMTLFRHNRRGYFFSWSVGTTVERLKIKLSGGTRGRL